MDEWPPALDIAKAMSDLLASKLEEPEARQITISRDEAVICFGLINALVEGLENQVPPGG